MGLNELKIEGRLTRDPEVKFTATGKRICTFSLAVDHSVKVGDEWVKLEPAWFFDFEAWEDLCETMAPFKKGDPLYVEGSLRDERWEHEGVKRSKVKIRVKTVRMADWAKKKTASSPEDDPPF